MPGNPPPDVSGDRLAGPVDPSCANQALPRRGQEWAAGALLFLWIVILAAWYAASGGVSGNLMDIDQAPPLTAEYRVDVNTSPWPELALLPQVGEILARRIVEFREVHGPFSSVESLLAVPGIGKKKLELMRPYLFPFPVEAAHEEPSRP